MMNMNGEFDDLNRGITPVTVPATAPGHDAAASWAKSDCDEAFAPVAAPPIWTQYIEDRLKQFCTR